MSVPAPHRADEDARAGRELVRVQDTRNQFVNKESVQVRSMFASIAHRYDLLNRLLSLSLDQYWRRVTVRKLSPFLPRDGVVLDLCTGTADLALQLSKEVSVLGCDFCHPMLVLGREKVKEKALDSKIRFVEGDALNLPFPSGSFHAVTVAFGLRNLEDYNRGLQEIHRVLRPGGGLAVLEFSQPQIPVFRQLYLLYFTQLLPRIGHLVSGKSGPYSYLPESVQEFPAPGKVDQMIRETGFAEVGHYSLTLGVVTLHMGYKRSAG